MDLKTIKDIIDIIEPIATIIAIFVGGIWSYLLFIRKRIKYPRANISHQIYHTYVSDDKVLLHVTTTISNIGDVLISIVSGSTWVKQMIPPHTKILDDINKDIDPVSEGKMEIEWPLLVERESKWEEGKFEIEPAESDQICYDFILDSYVQTVAINSFYENVQKYNRKLGWKVTTIYDLQKLEAYEEVKEGLKLDLFQGEIEGRTKGLRTDEAEKEIEKIHGTTQTPLGTTARRSKKLNDRENPSLNCTSAPEPYPEIKQSEDGIKH